MASMHGSAHSERALCGAKFVQLLDRPLQSSGTLIFIAPDRLQKQTLAPAPSRLTVDGDRLTVVQPDGKTSDVSLSEFPEIGALVESIRATLAGDSATLARYYTATLSGTADDWRCLLEPRDNRLRNFVTTIRMQGDGTRHPQHRDRGARWRPDGDDHHARPADDAPQMMPAAASSLRSGSWRC